MLPLDLVTFDTSNFVHSRDEGNSRVWHSELGEWVSLTPAGEVVLQLKTPYRDGTTHVVMAPL